MNDEYIRYYIHYGNDECDRKRMIPIKLLEKNWNPYKPSFDCLYASPVESAPIVMRDICRCKEYSGNMFDDYFIFTLADDAKVLEVRQVSDIKKYRCMGTIDYDRVLEDGYDAIVIYAYLNEELYWCLFGWECDTIMVFNPDIIVIKKFKLNSVKL